jgi:hypothetical protein
MSSHTRDLDADPRSGSLPETCPICGSAVEGGMLRARGPMGIVWRYAGTGRRLADEPVSDTRFFFCKARAARCTSCRIIVTPY